VLQVTRPSLPPLAEYRSLLPRLWRTGMVTNGGPYVRTLERALQRYLPARHLVAVANGTLALQLALRAVGRGQGEVVTTPFTYAATTTALVWEGYVPRFVDIDRETFNLDPELVPRQLGPRVVGVLPVEVFGNPAGCRELARIAREKSRWIVFDAAHCTGVRTAGRSLFDLGDASTLSFHATKSFHTFEGGAVATPHRDIAARVARLRSFGFEASGDVADPGINAKLTEPAAAMGLVNLRHIERWIRVRRARVRLYRDLLAPLGTIEYQRVEAVRPSATYMPILLPTRRSRDRVHDALDKEGIRTRRYFFPLTSDFSFVPRGLRRRCPVATEIAGRVLCLPLYHQLTERDVRRVVAGISRALA